MQKLNKETDYVEIVSLDNVANSSDGLKISVLMLLRLMLWAVIVVADTHVVVDVAVQNNLLQSLQNCSSQKSGVLDGLRVVCELLVGKGGLQAERCRRILGPGCTHVSSEVRHRV